MSFSFKSLAILLTIFGLLSGIFLYNLSQDPDQLRLPDIPKTYHFSSNRVPLQFDYSSNFPAKALGENYENGGYLNDERLELVVFSFEENITPNASSDTLAYIKVEKEDIQYLEGFLIDKYDSPCNLDLEVKQVELNNRINASQVNYKPNSECGGLFVPPPINTYYVYENGLLYTLAVKSEGNVANFDQVLRTLKFE